MFLTSDITVWEYKQSACWNDTLKNNSVKRQAQPTKFFSKAVPFSYIIKFLKAEIFVFGVCVKEHDIVNRDVSYFSFLCNSSLV